MFGAMFAARPERAAAEMLRVTKPGGRIAMANWTPTGFIGEMLRTTVGYVPAPNGVPSPLLWGTEDAVRSRLESRAASIKLTRRLMVFVPGTDGCHETIRVEKIRSQSLSPIPRRRT